MLLHLDQQQAHLLALMDENAVLTRELAAAQKRSTRVAQEQAQRLAALEATLVRLRGELIRIETERASLQERLSRIESHAGASPETAARKAEAEVQGPNQTSSRTGALPLLANPAPLTWLINVRCK